MPLEFANLQDSDVYIISPHLDDAIWSLGGLIACESIWKSTTIINVFSHSLFVNGGLTNPAYATELRVTEDAAAVSEVANACVINLGYSEAVNRGVDLNNIFNESYKPPGYLLDLILKDIKIHIPSKSVILLPAGFGNNIDHIFVRYCAAALELDYTVYYYEDMPYAARSKNVTAANNWLLKHGLNRRDYRISTDVIDKHIYLYNIYTTQIKDAHRNQMSSHLAKKGYGIWAK